MPELATCTLHPAEAIVGACERCGDFVCRLCLPTKRLVCARCAPGAGDPAAARPDLAKAFSWVMADPAWISKVAIGAVCMLFSFLLLPAFLLLGYELRIARREREAPQTTLPEWDELGSLMADGLKLMVCLMLPFFLIALVLGVIVGGGVGLMVAVGASSGGAGGSGGAQPALALGSMLLFFLFMAVYLISILAITYATPAIKLHYLRTGNLTAGLDFRGLWRIVAGRPGDYLLLWVYGFLMNFCANLVGQLLCLVGILATVPWAQYTDAYLIGRYWAWLDAEDAGLP